MGRVLNSAHILQVGGTGGLSGLIGVALVEILQGWKYVKKPCVELFKTILLLAGLLGKFP